LSSKAIENKPNISLTCNVYACIIHCVRLTKCLNLVKIHERLCCQFNEAKQQLLNKSEAVTSGVSHIHTASYAIL